MTFSEFQRSLASGDVPPVLLFHGDEPYLSRLGVRLLKRSVLAPGSEAFDFVSLSGREASAEAIVSQAGTVPMISERRLTLVYEFEALSPSQRTKLLDYVRSPYRTACLALVSFAKLEGKNRFEQGLLKHSAVVECGSLDDASLSALAGRMAQERGLSVADDALSVLLDWTGGELSRVDNELGKLESYCTSGSVRVGDIEAVVGARASGLADLAAAVAERRTGDALALLAELVDGGVSPAQLVSQLFGCWTMLWRIRTGRGGRGPAAGSARVLLSGVPNLREVALLRTSREYARGVDMFYRADVDIRRGVPASSTVGLLLHGLTSDSGWGRRGRV